MRLNIVRGAACTVTRFEGIKKYLTFPFNYATLRAISANSNFTPPDGEARGASSKIKSITNIINTTTTKQEHTTMIDLKKEIPVRNLATNTTSIIKPTVLKRRKPISAQGGKEEHWAALQAMTPAKVLKSTDWSLSPVALFVEVLKDVEILLSHGVGIDMAVWVALEDNRNESSPVCTTCLGGAFLVAGAGFVNTAGVVPEDYNDGKEYRSVVDYAISALNSFRKGNVLHIRDFFYQYMTAAYYNRYNFTVVHRLALQGDYWPRFMGVVQTKQDKENLIHSLNRMIAILKVAAKDKEFYQTTYMIP